MGWRKCKFVFNNTLNTFYLCFYFIRLRPTDQKRNPFLPLSIHLTVGKLILFNNVFFSPNSAINTFEIWMLLMHCDDDVIIITLFILGRAGGVGQVG